MRSSILRPRAHSERSAHKQVKTTSLRALAVAARLEREHADHAPEGPPGHDGGRADDRPTRRNPDPA